MLNSSSKSENMSKLVGFSLLKSFQRGRHKEIKSPPKKGKEKKNRSECWQCVINTTNICIPYQSYQEKNPK